MGLGAIISKVFTGGKGDLLKSIAGEGGIIDNLTLSKEEKAQINEKIQAQINAHIEKMQELSISETELYLKDSQSARDMNTKIQESANASKLSKNIAYILDIIFVATFLVMLSLIFFKSVPTENKEIFYMAFGLLGGYVGTVVSFHRGTTASSAKKQSQIEKMINEK